MYEFANKSVNYVWSMREWKWLRVHTPQCCQAGPKFCKIEGWVRGNWGRNCRWQTLVVGSPQEGCLGCNREEEEMSYGECHFYCVALLGLMRVILCSFVRREVIRCWIRGRILKLRGSPPHPPKEKAKRSRKVESEGFCWASTLSWKHNQRHVILHVAYCMLNSKLWTSLKSTSS